MDADDAMHPGRDDERELNRNQPGGKDPIGGENQRVAEQHAFAELRAERADHVLDQQERHRHAKYDLPQLPPRHAQGPTAVERPQRQGQVKREGERQQRGHRGVRPDHGEHLQPGLHGRQRNDAEDVVQQMADNEDEQEQSRPKPQTRDHRAPPSDRGGGPPKDINRRARLPGARPRTALAVRGAYDGGLRACRLDAGGKRPLPPLRPTTTALTMSIGMSRRWRPDVKDPPRRARPCGQCTVPDAIQRSTAPAATPGAASG